MAVSSVPGGVFQWSTVRLFRRIILLLLVLYLGAWTYRIVTRKYYVWLPGYVSWLFQQVTHQEKPVASPVHVFFFFVDHFEPGQDAAMMDRWVNEYPKIADRHRDSGGRRWQHTWFYPGEQQVDYNLTALQKLVAGGYGETELHLHHSNDTPQSGRDRFQRAIAWFQTFGFLKSPGGVTHFGFIHGNWGLDNSLGSAFCGNNRELVMLRELGCFADYTFSSIFNNAQPSSVNNIFEATDDDGPKSYDRGVALRMGVQPVGDLLIFQGPLLLVPTPRPAKLFLEVENAEIHAAVPVTPRRMDAWMRANIHVEGRPEWRFIKIHTHGGSTKEDADEILGPELDRALTYMEKEYNDGAHYVLHYVTAREAFNLARAAVDGKQGDPRQYYDYLIPPYVADGR
jgi:hypothetical protein